MIMQSNKDLAAAADSHIHSTNNENGKIRIVMYFKNEKIASTIQNARYKKKKKKRLGIYSARNHEPAIIII